MTYQSVGKQVRRQKRWRRGQGGQRFVSSSCLLYYFIESGIMVVMKTTTQISMLFGTVMK